jgi:hypothetical protein
VKSKKNDDDLRFKTCDPEVSVTEKDQNKRLENVSDEIEKNKKRH